MSQAPGDSPSDRAETIGSTESDHHRLLAAERRRVALDVLSSMATPVRLDVLAEAIAAYGDDEDREGRASGDRVERIAVTLHHHHLPMMTDLGVVRYDPESQRVEAVELPRTVT